MTKMRYFTLHPEVAASDFGQHTIVDYTVHPAIVSRLHYEFDGWTGDDLLKFTSCFLVTSRLATALGSEHLSGYRLKDVEISTSDVFKGLQPDVVLPPFKWLYITGKPGVDDFGTTTRQGWLVVSEKAMRVLKTGNMNHCKVEPYRPLSE